MKLIKKIVSFQNYLLLLPPFSFSFWIFINSWKWLEIAFDFGPGVNSLAVALIVLEVSLVAGTVGAMRESSRTKKDVSHWVIRMRGFGSARLRKKNKDKKSMVERLWLFILCFASINCKCFNQLLKGEIYANMNKLSNMNKILYGYQVHFSSSGYYK